MVLRMIVWAKRVEDARQKKGGRSTEEQSFCHQCLIAHQTITTQTSRSPPDMLPLKCSAMMPQTSLPDIVATETSPRRERNLAASE